MATNDFKDATDRRSFLGTLATGAAAMGLATIVTPLKAHANDTSPEIINPGDPEEMFKRINGKHRVVFDATQPHGIFPFAWPKIFLLTNAATGTPEKDNSVLVVLRHTAIGYAMEDRIWANYKIGELFKADDPETKLPSLRNPFWKPKPGAFKVPGFGEVAIGINQLQNSGVQFCVCEAALTVYSAIIAEGINKEPAEVRKDWVAGLLPGIQPVPSGVWALGRAQEKQCAYIFAG